MARSAPQPQIDTELNMLAGLVEHLERLTNLALENGFQDPADALSRDVGRRQARGRGGAQPVRCFESRSAMNRTLTAADIYDRCMRGF